MVFIIQKYANYHERSCTGLPTRSRRLLVLLLNREIKINYKRGLGRVLLIDVYYKIIW